MVSFYAPTANVACHAASRAEQILYSTGQARLIGLGTKGGAGFVAHEPEVLVVS